MASYIGSHAATDCLGTILYNLLTPNFQQEKLLRCFMFQNVCLGFYKTKIPELAFSLMGTLNVLE